MSESDGGLPSHPVSPMPDPATRGPASSPSLTSAGGYGLHPTAASNPLPRDAVLDGSLVLAEG